MYPSPYFGGWLGAAECSGALATGQRYAWTNTHSNAYPNIDTNCNADCHSYTNTDCDADANGDSDADTNSNNWTSGHVEPSARLNLFFLNRNLPMERRQRHRLHTSCRHVARLG